MPTWFKFTFPSGCVRWVHSSKSFVGLIPYVEEIPERLRDGTTINPATKWEAFKCWVNSYFYNESYIDLG
jgi:hypothetical protein